MKFIFFLSPYLVLFALSFTSPWFIFISPLWLRILIIIFLVVHTILYFSNNLYLKLNEFFERFQKPGIITLGVISTFFIVIFPVRDVRLGDGILLLENISLETSIYGYQLITDEILEGLVHSLTHHVLKQDPRLSFQIWSNFAGIVLILTLSKYFWNRKNGFLSLFLILSSGGFLLFYGYVENYSLTATYLILTTLFIAHNVENNQKISPYLLGILAALGASFHLVFGYTIFSFIYLSWIFSESKKVFIINSLKSSVLALGLLFGIFGYFFFFSNLQIDLGMSHITTHKFYPIRRLFSISHFKEIFFCLLFTSLPPLFSLLYFFLFEKNQLKIFLTERLAKYLLLIIFGFFLHAFLFDPLLGFPADWDLMSFYWSTLAIFSVKFLERQSFHLAQLGLAFLFSFVLLQATASILSKTEHSTEEKILQIQESVSEFKNIYFNRLGTIQPRDRKFHLHTSYFFFKKLKDLKKRQAPDNLIEMGKNLYEEFESKKGNFSKEWKKDFLIRSTKFHEEYLRFINKDGYN